MGGTKSKPKEPGQRSRSLDGTIGTGSGGGSSGGHPHQTLTPTRSPGVNNTRPGVQPMHNSAELALFGGVDSTNSITSPHRSILAAGRRHSLNTYDMSHIHQIESHSKFHVYTLVTPLFSHIHKLLKTVCCLWNYFLFIYFSVLLLGNCFL